MNFITNQVEKFVKDSFEKNPSYSFNDWTIMYNHSLMVRDVSFKIAKDINCDKKLLEIEALLHDIGKTYKTDLKTLREHHNELGYEVVKQFLPELNLSQEQSFKLEDFLRGQVKSVESMIIKDADIIAFFADKRLQEAFSGWADKEGLKDELQRKADKINKINFESSKELAMEPYQEMKNIWHLL